MSLYEYHRRLQHPIIIRIRIHIPVPVEDVHALYRSWSRASSASSLDADEMLLQASTTTTAGGAPGEMERWSSETGSDEDGFSIIDLVLIEWIRFHLLRTYFICNDLNGYHLSPEKEVDRHRRS
jgi:hypothetical protein